MEKKNKRRIYEGKYSDDITYKTNLDQLLLSICYVLIIDRWVPFLRGGVDEIGLQFYTLN